MSNDKYRANFERNSGAAASGGPGYRAHSAGKGDVSRQRGKGLTRYELGMELIKISEEFGNDSPEYAAKLKEWRNAQS